MSVVGGGEICVESDSNWMIIRYRASWCRTLVGALLAVGLMRIWMALVPGVSTIPHYAWVTLVVLAIVIGYVAAHSHMETFVRACVRRAGGLPLRRRPDLVGEESKGTREG